VESSERSVEGVERDVQGSRDMAGFPLFRCANIDELPPIRDQFAGPLDGDAGAPEQAQSSTSGNASTPGAAASHPGPRALISWGDGTAASFSTLKLNILVVSYPSARCVSITIPPGVLLS
jgi:hypothetical protein